MIGERMLVNLRKVTTIDEMGGWGEVGNMKCEVVSVMATAGAPVGTICHPGVGGQHGGEAGQVGGGSQRGGGRGGGPEGQSGHHELPGHHASQPQGLVLCGECSQELQC